MKTVFSQLLIETVFLIYQHETFWEDSPVAYLRTLFLTRSEYWIFGRDGWKNSSKTRKRPNLPELRRGNFSNLSLKHQNTDLHFSHGQFPLLMPKTGQKWKTCILRSISHCSLQFYPVPPQNNGLSSLFYHTSLSDLVLTWIVQNFVFKAYANKKLCGKTFEKGRFDPITSWYKKS